MTLWIPTMHHHPALNWSLFLLPFLSQSFPFPLKPSFLKKFNRGKEVRKTKERILRSFNWRPRNMLWMRPMTLPWGPLLGTREGAELSKRVLTQAPLPPISLILILGVRVYCWLQLWGWWRWGGGRRGRGKWGYDSRLFLRRLCFWGG